METRIRPGAEAAAGGRRQDVVFRGKENRLTCVRQDEGLNSNLCFSILIFYKFVYIP